MRGRTLNNSFIILDEAQNTTPEQMKMFLTRIGFGSKVVVTGDDTQIDLPGGRSRACSAWRRCSTGIDGLAWVHLGRRDVVRHRIVPGHRERLRGGRRADRTRRGARRPATADAPATGGDRAAVAIEVFAADEQSDQPVDTLRWVRLAEAVLDEEGVRGEAELSMLFVDEQAMADLNKRFLGKDGPTDVLAFPIDEEPVEGGRSPDSGGTGPGLHRRAGGRCRRCSATW